MLVKTVPRALPRACLRLSSKRVNGLGMLVAEPRSAPLADGSEDVLGLSLVRLMRARLVLIRHVGPGAGLVQLEQGDRVEEAPRRFPGRVLGMSGAVGVVRGLWPEAEDREYRIPDVERLGGGRLPRLRDGGPDGASHGALVRNVHGGVLPADTRLQARGAEVLVALAPALVCALHVAVVHGDIQVVALFLWVRRVLERLGESGQAGAALRVRYEDPQFPNRDLRAA